MKLKRIIAMLAVVAMMATMLFGCGDGGKETTAAPDDKTTVADDKTTQAPDDKTTQAPEESTAAPSVEISYPLDTKETLTIAMLATHYKAAGDAKDITDTAYFKAWQEQTGVTIKVDVYETEDAMKLMVNSGDVPDILMWATSKYSGGEVQMIADGILSPLTWDELEKWAPDYAEILKANDVNRKLLTTADGAIVGFGCLTVSQNATSGMIVRRDWMEELNIKDPTTADEFLDMLRAFKTKKGAEYPLAVTNSRLNHLLNFGDITSPFGLVSAAAHQNNGKYVIGYYEQEFKAVLEFLHTMYEEELMNRDYLTVNQNAVNAMLYDGRAGVVRQSVIAGLGTYVPAMKETDPNAVLGGIPGLCAPNSDKAYYGQVEAPVHEFKGMITQKCKNKELAMKFLNYNYTEEGHLLTLFGIEGTSYTMVNGEPTYTDLIIKNPDGLTVAVALQQYCRGGAFWPYVADPGYFNQTTALPEQEQAKEVWDKNDRVDYYLPAISPAPEDNAEYAKIKTAVDTYYLEMRAKFISGEVSLDQFDTYIQGLKDRGIDRMIEIMQKALDEFNAR